jgi:hypothetical protein
MHNIQREEGANMLKQILIITVGWVWVALGVPACALLAAAPEHLRAAYIGLHTVAHHPEILARLRDHDFTLALIADRGQGWQDDRWQAALDRANALGLPVMAVIHFAVPHHLRAQPGGFRPYVNRAGAVYAATPCPADAGYWQAVIGEPLRQFAERAGPALVGAAFDAEMYGSDINWYADVCYCDECWREFAASKGATFAAATADMAAASRFEHLMRQNLVEDYTRFQWQQVRAITAAIARQVQRRRPAFTLGFLCYQHNWFFTAVVHGFGTKKQPALVFSESSYVRGYTPHVDVERDDVRGQHQLARYIPGIWLERFAPATLPAQLVDAALHSDGYWLYTEDWKLTGTPDAAAHWSAMRST